MQRMLLKRYVRLFPPTGKSPILNLAHNLHPKLHLLKLGSTLVYAQGCFFKQKILYYFNLGTSYNSNVHLCYEP